MMKSETVVLVMVPDGGEKSDLEAILSQAGYKLAVSVDQKGTHDGGCWETIDLCLLDYDLWEGEKTCSDKGSGTPVVLALVTPGNVELALQDLHQGIDHLILKPFTSAALVERIEQVIQLKRTRWMNLQTERMAVVNRLTASIAHEINNPLQSVQNCIHMIQHGKRSDQTLDRYIAMVNEEIVRLSKEVKRMLDFYRPGNLQRQRVDTNQLVAQIVATWDQRFQDGHIILQLELSDGLSPVLVVSSQIQQAIENLLENSVEAMPDGGHLVVRTSQLDNQVIIDIEDNGLGIPESMGEQVFEPFMSTKDERVGLGLTITYGIVAAHGGSLELVRQRPSGAHFRIILPVGLIL